MNVMCCACCVWCVACCNTGIPMALCANFCRFLVIYVFFCYICIFVLFKVGIFSNLGRQTTKFYQEYCLDTSYYIGFKSWKIHSYRGQVGGVSTFCSHIFGYIGRFKSSCHIFGYIDTFQSYIVKLLELVQMWSYNIVRQE